MPEESNYYTVYDCQGEQYRLSLMGFAGGCLLFINDSQGGQLSVAKVSVDRYQDGSVLMYLQGDEGICGAGNDEGEAMRDLMEFIVTDLDFLRRTP